MSADTKSNTSRHETISETIGGSAEVVLLPNQSAPSVYASGHLGLTQLRGGVWELALFAEQGVYEPATGQVGRQAVVAGRVTMPLEAWRSLSTLLTEAMRRYDTIKTAPADRSALRRN